MEKRKEDTKAKTQWLLQSLELEKYINGAPKQLIYEAQKQAVRLIEEELRKNKDD